MDGHREVQPQKLQLHLFLHSIKKLNKQNCICKIVSLGHNHGAITSDTCDLGISLLSEKIGYAVCSLLVSLRIYGARQHNQIDLAVLRARMKLCHAVTLHGIKTTDVAVNFKNKSYLTLTVLSQALRRSLLFGCLAAVQCYCFTALQTMFCTVVVPRNPVSRLKSKPALWQSVE